MDTTKKALRQVFKRRREAVRAAMGSAWGPTERDMFFSFLGAGRSEFPGKTLSYFAMGSEPSILPTDPAETWLFPKVVAGQLEWFEWSAVQPLPQAGDHGRRELMLTKSWPLCNAGLGAICFVPQLAVDFQGQRLGYGGGYYDRFLAQPGVLDSHLLVACTHDDLIVPQLPAEPHDVPVDVIVTNTRVLVVSRRVQMLNKLGRDSAAKSRL